MLEIVLFLITFLFTLWLLHWYYTMSYYERYLKDIPGPKFLPILGNILEYEGPTSLFPKALHFMKIYNGNFKIYIGAQPYLVICDPKDIEFFLSSSSIITKAERYHIIQDFFGPGLLPSSGQRWKKHRKLLTPAFHYQILESFVDVFDAASDILVTKWKPYAENSPVDISPFLARCALDIVCETTMSTSINAQNDLESPYTNNINTFIELYTELVANPLLSNYFFRQFSATYRKFRKASIFVQNYSRSVVSETKIKFLDDIKLLGSDTLGRKRKLALLDLMLEYSRKDPSFTDEHIHQEVDIFMFAGYDTTATTMAFVLYCLAKYPEVQKKAYTELQTIFSDDPNRGATYSDLQEMKYLAMVIKETLRIYSTVPVYGRTLDEDVNCNGKLLPKGLQVVICAYGVHHSDAFEDPEVFNPERFNVENSKNRNRYTYVPFSLGPRSCIGQKYAMLEMKTVISKVLRNFELLLADPEHKMVLKCNLIIRSEDPILLKLKKRH